MIYPILLCLLVAPFHSVSEEVEDKVSRREAQMLGGWHNMPLDSKTIKRLQGFVEESHNRESNSEYWYKIKEVLSARTQVVNGFNFDISLILEPTGCLKSDMDSDKECLVQSSPGQKVEECQIEIYEPLPKFEPEITSKSCKDWTI